MDSMKMKLRRKVKLFNIKEREDGDSTLCPLCDSKLSGCHIGVFCSDEKCHYVDGVAFLNAEEQRRYSKKIDI